MNIIFTNILILVMMSCFSRLVLDNMDYTNLKKKAYKIFKAVELVTISEFRDYLDLFDFKKEELWVYI